MKQIFLFLLLFIFLSPRAMAMEASVNACTFKAENTPYAEVYIHIVGGTVSFSPVDSSNVQASVKVLMIFRQGDKIINYDKYLLTSPLAPRPIDFIDMKRFGLSDGQYELEVTLEDASDSTNVFTFYTPLEVDFPSDAISMSGIQLLGNMYKSDVENVFVKNGYYLEPLPFQFYNRFTSTLAFYTEIYHTDKVLSEDFYIRYLVRSANSTSEEDNYIVGQRRKKPFSANVLLLRMDIRTLPSGKYELVVEVRDRTKNCFAARLLILPAVTPT